MSDTVKSKTQLLSELTTLRKKITKLENQNSKLKKIEENLAEEQHLFQEFMQNIPDAIYFKDINGVFLRINKAQSNRLALSDPEEAVGKTDIDFFSSEDAERARNEDQAVIRSAKVSIKERKKKLFDGSTGWVSATKVPLTDRKGNIIGVFGLTRDITERMLSEVELKTSRDKLKQAKRETDTILKNVKEGLFILDSKFTIGSQYSRVLEIILEEKRLKKKNLVKLMESHLSAEHIPIIQEYLELMFDSNIDEDSVNELNPLSDIEFNFSNIQQDSDSLKYLSFKFSRISLKEKIIGLIATVNDITEQKLLTKRLEESKAQSKRQMDWLLSILHVEPQLLEEFITGVQTELNLIDKALKSGTDTNQMSELLNDIFRSVHLIKGNASLLEINFFSKKAHEFEEKIEILKKKENLCGADFTTLVFQLGQMNEYLEELHSLIDKIGRIRTNFRPKRRFENKMLVQSIENLIRNLAKELQKEVSLEHAGFRGEEIPGKYWLMIKDILIQLVRNSLMHGIENPFERDKNNKSLQGLIKISTLKENDSFILNYQDDGQGLNLDKLQDKALASGNWNKDEVENWNDSELAEMIYQPGISTAQKTTLIAGRGIGMDIIKQKIESHGGKISLNFEKNKFTAFVITLPI